MSDISFADGMKILELARQGITAPPAAPSKPLPAYGPHNSVLTPDQATTLHLLWSILGIDGSTVGRGSVTTIGANNVGDRQGQGPAGDGNGAPVPALGSPDSGPDGSRLGQQDQGPLSDGGQEGDQPR